MDEEAQRLSQLFKLRATKSQAKFGQENDIGSGSMVWQYLHARRPLSLATAMKFARGLQVELNEFSPRLAAARNELLEYGDVQAPLDEYARVPFVRLEVEKSARKYTAQPVSEGSRLIAFRRDWLRSRGLNSAALMAAECPDDGMRPTLAQGDLVVINTADTEPVDTVVYAIGYEGQFLVRRVFRDEGSWWLTCDNASSHRFMRKHFIDKHCFILGRVVHRQCEMV